MNKFIRLSSVLSLILLTYLLQACGGGSSGGSSPDVVEPPHYSYTQPQLTNDGWAVADLNQQGIDPAPLENLINKIQNGDIGYRLIDSVAIAQHGQLLFEKRTRTQLDLADGWADNQNIELHILNSATKSVTSALIGIAIDRGDISDVNVPVHDFFADKQPIANWDSAKASITLENWLNMQSGYDWDEWNVSYLNASNLNSQMNNASDPIQFLLDRPMATTPGTTFAYSTGVSYGIGRILQIASGRTVAAFLRDYLLDPLQINQFDYWTLDNQLHTGSALYLTTRDMAKFGQLYLDGGVWNGTRVISESWINQSTQQRVNFSEGGYGYQWWFFEYTVKGQTFASYSARGFGGQYIYVFPELDLVVVLTGHAYQDSQGAEQNTRDVLEFDILPNFVADKVVN